MFELNDLLKMKVSELKAQLSKHGLNTKGNKIQLVQKLAEFLNIDCNSLTVGSTQPGEDTASQLSNSETKPRRARKSTGSKSKPAVREPTADDYTQACSRDLSVVLERIDPIVTASVTNLRCSASKQNNVEALPEIASFLESPTFSSHLSSISRINNSFPSISNIPGDRGVSHEDNFMRMHTNFDLSLCGEGSITTKELDSPVRLDEGDDVNDDDLQEESDHLFAAFNFQDKLHRNSIEDNCMMSFIESMQGLVINGGEPLAQQRSSCMFEHSNCDKLFTPQTAISYKNVDPMMNVADFNLGNEEYSYENTSDSFEAAKFCPYDSSEVVFDKIDANVDADAFSFGESLCHMTSGFQDPLLSYADQNSKQFPEDVFESSCSDLVPTAGYSDSLIDSDNDPLIEIDEEFIEESIICEEDVVSFDEQEHISKRFYYDGRIEKKFDLLPGDDLNESLFDGTSNEVENVDSSSSKLLNNDFNSMMNLSDSLVDSGLSRTFTNENSIDQILEPSSLNEAHRHGVSEETLKGSNEENLFEVLQAEITIVDNHSNLNANIFDSELHNDKPEYPKADSSKQADESFNQDTFDSQYLLKSISNECPSDDDDDGVEDDEKEVSGEIDNANSPEINRNLITDIYAANQLNESSVQNVGIEISLESDDNRTVGTSDELKEGDDVKCPQIDCHDDDSLEECTASSAEESRAIDNDLIVLLDDDEILDAESIQLFSEDEHCTDNIIGDSQFEQNMDLEKNFELPSPSFSNSSFHDTSEENLVSDENIDEIQVNVNKDLKTESNDGPFGNSLELIGPEGEIRRERESTYSSSQTMLTTGGQREKLDLFMETSDGVVEEIHDGIEFQIDEMPSLEISQLKNDVEMREPTNRGGPIENDVLPDDHDEEVVDASIDLAQKFDLNEIEATNVSNSLIVSSFMKNSEINKIKEDVTLPMVVQIVSTVECPNEIIDTNNSDEVNKSIITENYNGSDLKCKEDADDCVLEVDDLEHLLELRSCEHESEDVSSKEDASHDECDEEKQEANLIEQKADVMNDDIVCEINSRDVSANEISDIMSVEGGTPMVSDGEKLAQGTDVTNDCEINIYMSQCSEEDDNFRRDETLLNPLDDTKSDMLPSEEKDNKLVAYESSSLESDDDYDDREDYNVELKSDSNSKMLINKGMESEGIAAKNDFGLKDSFSHSSEQNSRFNERPLTSKSRDDHISNDDKNKKISDHDAVINEHEDFVRRNFHLSDKNPNSIHELLKSCQRLTRRSRSGSSSSTTCNFKSEDRGHKRKRRSSRPCSRSESPRRSRARNRQRRSRSRSRSRHCERSSWNKSKTISGSDRDGNFCRDAKRRTTYSRDHYKFRQCSTHSPRKLHDRQRMTRRMRRSRDHSERRSHSMSRKRSEKKFSSELERKSRPISSGVSSHENREMIGLVNLENASKERSLKTSSSSLNLRSARDVRLDVSTCDLNLEIYKDGSICTPITNGELSFLWGNVRSNFGAKTGKMCFQVKVLKKLKVDGNSPDEMNLSHGLRVGFSFGFHPPHLGKESLTYAYDSRGMRMSNDDISVDGMEPYTYGDIITAYSDMTGDPYTISFSKNDSHIDSFFTIHPSFVQNLPIFPHVATRNCSFKINFAGGKSSKDLWREVKDGFRMIGDMKDEELVLHSPSTTKQESKVLLMCGLPGSGKTQWVRNFLKDKDPKEFFTILGDIFILNKMEVNDYTEKWRHIANRCIHKLLMRCSQLPRNYVLDQTNVYKNARKKKLEYFQGFKCKFVVVVTGEAEYERRCGERKREGRFLSDAVLSEMKRNFKLPERNETCEVEFIGVGEEESKLIVQSYNRQGRSYYVQHLKHQRQRHPERVRSRIPPSAPSLVEDSSKRSLAESSTANLLSTVALSSMNYATCKIQCSMLSSMSSSQQLHASSSKTPLPSSSSPSSSNPSQIPTNSDELKKAQQSICQVKEESKIKFVSKSLAHLSFNKSNTKTSASESSSQSKSSVNSELQSITTCKNVCSSSNSGINIVSTSVSFPIVKFIQKPVNTSADLPSSLDDSIKSSQTSSSSSSSLSTLSSSTSSSSSSSSVSLTSSTPPVQTNNYVTSSVNVLLPENFKELMHYPPPSYYQPSINYYNPYAVYSAYQYPYYDMQYQQYYNYQYPVNAFPEQMLQQNSQSIAQQFHSSSQQQQWVHQTDMFQHPLTNASSLQQVSNQSSKQHSLPSSYPSSSSSSTSSSLSSQSISVSRAHQIKSQVSSHKTPMITQSKVDASIGQINNKSIDSFKNVQSIQPAPNHNAPMKHQQNQKNPLIQSSPSQQQQQQQQQKRDSQMPTSLKCSTNDFWQLAIFNDSKRDGFFSQHAYSAGDSKKRKEEQDQDSKEPSKKARPLIEPTTSCNVSSSVTSTIPKNPLPSQSSYSTSSFKSWPSTTLASSSNDRSIHHNRTPFRPNFQSSNDGDYTPQRNNQFEPNYDMYPKVASNNSRFPSKVSIQNKHNGGYHENMSRPRNMQHPNNKRFSNPQSFHRNESNSQNIRFRPRLQDLSRFPFQENYMDNQTYNNRHTDSQVYVEEHHYYEPGYNCRPLMTSEPPFMRSNRPDARPSNRRFPNSNTGMRMDMHADERHFNNDPWY